MPRKSHDYTKWSRIDFDGTGEGSPQRQEATKETNRDLQKSIPQLICDVHEEVSAGRSAETNLAHAIKRMVSMMGRVALEQEKSTRTMIRLTRWLTALTVVLTVLTILTVFTSLRACATMAPRGQSPQEVEHTEGID
ncbi:MAG: hypothetical protein IT431_16130 [Phycisphaerales bacterium]|nr:hypothetical protein [Phycisphaerales bacterium]